jgi:hypothetical protein
MQTSGWDLLDQDLVLGGVDVVAGGARHVETLVGASPPVHPQAALVAAEADLVLGLRWRGLLGSEHHRHRVDLRFLAVQPAGPVAGFAALGGKRRPGIGFLGVRGVEQGAFQEPAEAAASNRGFMALEAPGHPFSLYWSSAAGAVVCVVSSAAATGDRTPRATRKAPPTTAPASRQRILGAPDQPDMFRSPATSLSTPPSDARIAGSTPYGSGWGDALRQE